MVVEGNSFKFDYPPNFRLETEADFLVGLASGSGLNIEIEYEIGITR